MSSKLEASYDGKRFEIIHERKPSRYVFKIIDSDIFIGSMETPFIMTSVWMNHGKEYQIEIEGNNCYFKDRTRNLAVTKYRRGAFSSLANYTRLDEKEGDPNPYLIAILSLFVAIFDSFGLGEI